MQPLCFVCNNCALICAIHETALSRGFESDWWRVGDGDLYAVEVPFIGFGEFEKMVQFAKAIAPDARSSQLGLLLA